MTKPISFELQSPAWQRNLRWAAIALLSGATLAGIYAGAILPLLPIGFFLALLTAWNLALPFLEEHLPMGTQAFVALQVLADITLLTLLFWWAGGLVNPLVGLFIFELLLAGLLLSPGLTLAVALGVSVCVAILAFAPPLMVNGEVLSFRSSPIWPVILLSWGLLIAATTWFIRVFFRRLGFAEDELRLQVKMEALGRLVTGLAHEVGTPLNSILLLAEEAAGEASPGQARRLRMIANEARKCGDVVSHLLGYSRTLVRSEDDVGYVPVVVEDWVNKIYSSLAAGESRRSRVSFAVERQGVAERLSIPALAFQQVLENLLKNALYAVRNEPDPRIVVRINRDWAEDALVFEVADNGPGFSAEERERAFEAFFSTKTHDLSPGLGLYMAYYLVNQLCGRIVIADQSGRGAILRVSLPRLAELDEQVPSGLTG